MLNTIFRLKMNIQSNLESMKICFKPKIPNIDQIQTFNSTDTAEMPILEPARIYIHKKSMDVDYIKYFNNAKDHEYKSISFWKKVEYNVSYQPTGSLTLFRLSDSIRIKSKRWAKASFLIVVLLLTSFSIFTQNITLLGFCTGLILFFLVNVVIWNN